MEGDIVSAGSFVAAVLEHSGFLAQGRFLENFREFFRDAGALVYFIAAVGGLLSVLLFGSFRAARYLIIGPAIYWFLVGPTIEVDGALAKLGGGTPRGFIGSNSRGEAESDRNSVLEKSGEAPQEKIKLAYGFWFFAKPMSDFVEKFVDVMLKNEDGADLAVGSKVRGLEVIARAMPEYAESIQMIEGEVAKNCLTSYTAALGAAESYIKTSITRGLSSSNAAADRSKHEGNYKRNVELFLAEAESTPISITETDTPHIKRLIEDSGRAGSGSPIARALYYAAEDRAQPQISCAQGWNLVLERLWHDSAKELPVILRLASGEWASEEAQAQACRELTRKIYDDLPGGVGAGEDTDGPCELRPGIALALLWNHLSREDTFQRVAQRHSSQNDSLNPKSETSVSAISSLAQNAADSAVKMINDPTINVGRTALGGANATMEIGVVRGPGPWRDNYEATIEHAPAAFLHLMQGVSNVEQVSMPIYEMTRMRQQIFTWALQLPYYQGMIMYVISVAYPFAALIVLLPGRAAGFLNIPLAWLWVKSWDIGFAGIILLERVMYNLLPNWSVNPSLREGPWTYDQLPIALGEGYNFSHVQGVSHHYAILGLATLGMPALMGAITLKAKKAVLASFVDAPTSQARDASMRASGAYSITASNERAQLLNHLKGFATQAPVLGSGGVEGGLKGSAAWAKASMVGAREALTNSAIEASGGGLTGMALLGKTTAVGSKAIDATLKAYGDGVKAQVAYESAYRAAYDPTFGRWGMLQMYSDAYSAALDGAGARLQGGFETNDQKADAINAYMSMSSARLEFLMDADKAVGELKGLAFRRTAEGAASLLKNSDEVSGAAIGRMGAAALIATGDVLAEEGINRQVVGRVVGAMMPEMVNSVEGYDDPLPWARVWGHSAGIYSAINQDKDLKEMVFEAAMVPTAAGAIIGQMYLNSPGNEIPGGSSLMDGVIAGLGGDREVIQINENTNLDAIESRLPNTTGDYFLDLEQGLSKSPISNFFGVGDPEGVFRGVVASEEASLKVNDREAYDAKLGDMLDQLEVYAPYQSLDKSLKLEDRAAQAVEITINLAQERGDDSEKPWVFLPTKLDELVHEAPISALTISQNWFQGTNAPVSSVDLRRLREEYEDRDKISAPQQLRKHEDE